MTPDVFCSARFERCNIMRLLWKVFSVTGPNFFNSSGYPDLCENCFGHIYKYRHPHDHNDLVRFLLG